MEENIHEYGGRTELINMQGLELVDKGGGGSDDIQYVLSLKLSSNWWERDQR